MLCVTETYCAPLGDMAMGKKRMLARHAPTTSNHFHAGVWQQDWELQQKNRAQQDWELQQWREQWHDWQMSSHYKRTVNSLPGSSDQLQLLWHKCQLQHLAAVATAAMLKNRR